MHLILVVADEAHEGVEIGPERRERREGRRDRLHARGLRPRRGRTASRTGSQHVRHDTNSSRRFHFGPLRLFGRYNMYIGFLAARHPFVGSMHETRAASA